MISRRSFISAFLSAGALLSQPRTLFGCGPLDHLKYVWTSIEVQELLNAFPTRLPDTLTRNTQGGTEVYDKKNGVFLTLNETASIIWSYCDGTHCVGDMVKKITERYNVPEEICKKDVIVTLLSFKRKGVIKL